MKKWLVAGLSMMAIACGGSQQEGAATRKDGFTPELRTKEDSLYHEIMQGHDVGMGKMGKLERATRQVQQALDSIAKLPAAKTDGAYKQALVQAQKDLEYAEYSMDTWMKEFKPDSAKGNEQMRLQYLEAERDKIATVKKHILDGLQLADSLLKK